MGAFESYGSCAFPEIHNNETYMVFVDITTKFSKNINPNIRWGKFPHEKIFMENFFRGIFDHEKSLYHMVTRTHREIRFLWFVLPSWCFFFMCFMKFSL